MNTVTKEIHNLGQERLLKLIETKQAVVGVLGMGYVGFPLALECVNKGYHVIGFDKNSEKVSLLAAGHSHINDIDENKLKEALHTKRFQVSDNMASIQDCDIIVICVPTPLDKKEKIPDLTYIDSAVDSMIAYGKTNQLLILESTTYPGTTKKKIAERMEASRQMNIGTDFFTAYSPERIDPGNIQYEVSDIPKVVGGITKTCTELASAFYSTIVNSIHPVTSAEVAETAKLLENTYRYVNIALINEMALNCRELDIDIWEVINAADTKPFGFQKFNPGPGVGGHCIPIDPFYFKWVANQKGLKTKLIDLADEINSEMPISVSDYAIKLVNKEKRSILLVGAAYKKNTNDPRESSALTIMGDLMKKGCETDYHDPFIGKIRLDEGSVKYSVPFTKEQINQYDVVIIHTDHDDIDYSILQDTSPVIFDTRNVCSDKLADNLKLVTL
ncbi:nucleotide sugar dehydrogenase [Bacillus atrophaeus]|jgi:UDP-N-acetyl-D-glucosamine dehydrogenase|uniref:nucleotide sugar dehydrogenase n=1 Tax=Bacillus atrophaeus TaxID=1452 RepID=UPI00032E79E6|nr:nucleotide sugar dehydrogenase [Bacillus atrophaeus]AKL86390.1 YtcA [Bacillus atrophaeus UCMB-5137]ARW08352.1 UDP-N-acetylglucosamine 6-dehydrogenase [Bacillus atrophaeus]ATO27544.1 nucleotide sugar dehydrogenase [Bacillus atrophaeus]MBJ7894654.1 nucleotide sugar dehydrogenase [Bacillus atrophaeus]MBU5261662.1 nucleotide sugar dehydrogenase [Bacillus atrophaeus]